MMQEAVQEIENAIREATYDMHTALPGTITEFDPASGLASVKPEGKVTMKTGEKLSYPSIVKVPVSLPQGNGRNAVVAYPVKPGDGCLIIVCENDLKPWMSHGKETDSNMKFDLTNAVCIPGLYGEGCEALQKACEEEAVIIKNEEMELMLKKDLLEAKYHESSISMGEEEILLECGGGSICIGKEEILLTCAGCSISIGGSGVTITGDVDIDGNLTVGGNLAANGDLTVSGVIYGEGA